VRRFRAAFVDATRPKFLPAGWSVDAVVGRDFGEYSAYRAEAATAPAAGVGVAAAAAAAGGDGNRGHGQQRVALAIAGI
jgi:hypothetical protein